MPIYEYQCGACHHEMEVLQKLSEAVLVDCPQCQQPRLKKKISAAGFRLKGGGWYETDFKTGGKKNIAGDTAGKTTSPSADSTKSGDSSKSSKPGNSAASSD